MDVRVEIQVDTSAVEARLGALAERELPRALAMGLAQAGNILASDVVQVADRRGIKGRTGTLLASVGQWADLSEHDPLRIYVGVPGDSPAARYAYLLTEESRLIQPQGHPYLAIPIESNLTGAGVARYSSPWELPRDAVDFRGRTVGITDMGGEYYPMFALVREVTVHGVGDADRPSAEVDRIARQLPR